MKFLFRLLLLVASSFLLSPAQAAAAEYVLGTGDTIRITVYQNPDLTLETRVTEAGTISYPLVGQVQIGGKSVSQAEKAIGDALRNGNFVKQPQVSVLVLQIRGSQASVLGQVLRPGRYPLESADLRLSDLLAIAGGISPGVGSDIAVVTGTRNGQPMRMEVDLPVMFATAKRENDIVIQNGDVVWVDRAPVIYIYGEVQRPGQFRLERDWTVMQALASAGGLTLRGTEKGMRVNRRNADGAVQVLPLGMNDKLQAGDVVYVRESLF